MRISFEELLYNFSSITVNTGFFIHSIKDGNLKRFKKEFLNQFELQNYPINPSGLDILVLRKDGIYFDESEIFSNFIHTYKTNVDDVESLKILISKLENIKTYKDLQKTFPLVEKKYRHMLKDKVTKYNRLLEKKENEINNLNPKKSDYKTKVEKINRKYKINGAKVEKELTNAINTIKGIELKNIGILIDYNRRGLRKLCEIPQQSYYIIDHDRIHLIVSEIIKNICLKEKKDSNMYKACIKYLNNYIDNNAKLINENYALNICYDTPLGIRKKEYSISNIKSFLENIKKEENKRTKKEVEKLNYSFLECKDHNTKDSLYRFINRFSSQDTDLEKQKLLKDKINYYENLGYEKIYYGIDSFNGYIGIYLDNGVVIMDKFFNKTGSIATEEAVYITTKDDFSTVSRLSKTEVQEKRRLGELKVEKVNHSLGWQERANIRIKTLKGSTSNC